VHEVKAVLPLATLFNKKSIELCSSSPLLLLLLLLLQKLGYSVHEVKAVPLEGPGSLAGLERCCEGQQARQQAQVRSCW
jgi:hypothetical protein